MVEIKSDLIGTAGADQIFFLSGGRDVGQGHAGHAMACPDVGTLKLSGHQSHQEKKRKKGEGRGGSRKGRRKIKRKGKKEEGKKKRKK